MTFSTLVYVYFFGGLTFIPLILAAVLVPAWFLLPHVEDGGKRKQEDGEKKDSVDYKTREESLAAHEEKTDGAACGTFAVLRSYDFAAATAALAARSGGGSGHGSTASPEHMVDTGGTSESVYQSMYRSVFDRNKNMPSNKALLENEDESTPSNGRVKKRTTPANIFYIIIRHGHLILYDSPAQLEVRHVISLAHHDISLSEGPNTDTADMKDGDLFIKRTAIALTPIELPSGGLQSKSVPSKPFYLFSSICMEKEDFYHALLYTRSHAPLPLALDPDNLIKLQSTLHSTSLTPESRMLNALISRLFLALHDTDRAKTLVRNKIEKKISRVQKPNFIASLALQSIDLGDAAPVFSNLRLKDLNISGDMTVALDVKYTGGIKLTIAALAKLDLGPRFKTRTADLVLASSLQRLTGHVLVRIKPSPSNRIWFCFEEAPEMEVKVEPVVSQRQITYTFILRAIEERIRAVVAETLVKPNWDDVAFYDTRGQIVRGGMWAAEGGENDVDRGAEVLAERNEKTQSMPALAAVGADGPESSATSSGSEAPSRLAPMATKDVSAAENLKRRSATSLPARSASTTPVQDGNETLYAKSLRSPSLTSPSASTPTISLDQSSANFDPMTAHDAAQAQQAARRWRIRTKADDVKKDAIETMREMRDRSLREDESASVSAEDEAGSPTSISFADRSLRSSKRTGTDMTASSATSTSTTRTQQQRKNILAAAQAAREWSWNAIAARTKNAPGARANSVSSTATSQEPMGRGQPLPPPGQPLPGPQKGFFTGSMGSMRRKPVPASKAEAAPALPPRRRQEDGAEKMDNDGAGEAMEEGSEFGDWKENSGSTDNLHQQGLLDVTTEDNPSASNAETTMTPDFSEEPKKKVPPPLPARPRPAHSQSKSVFEVGGLESDDGDDEPAVTSATQSQHPSTNFASARPREDPLDGIRVVGTEDVHEDTHSDDDELVAISAPFEDESGLNEGVNDAAASGNESATAKAEPLPLERGEAGYGQK